MGRVAGFGVAILAGFSALVASTVSLLAAQPTNGAIWHQTAATPGMMEIEWFSAYTLWFIVPITLFVLALLFYVALKFNARANPEPSKTSHNTFIEVVWTVVPIIILVAIALPSFELLEGQFDPGEEPTVTVKATGQSWYWEYEYQDGSELSFSSYMFNQAGAASNVNSPEYAQGLEEALEQREELGKTDLEVYPRLLAVDNELVVPVNETVRVLVAGDPGGVIHNFAVPSFGLKMDAIPGRINETWFKALKEGLYYGQCSELCGKYHAFMPIGIRVVSRDQYDAWKEQATAGSVEDANRSLMAAIERDKNIKLAQGNEPAATN